MDELVGAILPKMQRIIFVISFSILALLRNWYLLAATQAFHYPTFRPSAMALVHLVLSHFIIAGTAWLLLAAAEHSKRRWALFLVYGLMWVVILPGLLFLRSETNISVHYPVISFAFWKNHLGTFASVFLFLGVCASAITLAWKHLERFIFLQRAAFTLILPFAIYHLGRVTLLVATTQPLPHSTDLGAQRKDAPRTILVIFDEFDYSLLQEARAAGSKFPNFDFLESNGLHATHAYPPAIHTHAAMPSYFFGRRISQFCRLPNDDMRLRFEGASNDAFWSQEPTLISDVYSMGIQVSLVGWYHPYCQMMGRHLRYCQTNRSPFFQSAKFAPKRIPLGIQQALNPFDLRVPYHQRRYELVLEQAESALKQADTSVVFLHLPVPHLPGIYSDEEQRLVTDYGDTIEEQKKAYRANLVLADSTLGHLMQIEQETGRGRPVTWMVSGDHSMHAWRWNPAGYPEEKVDRRIPFYVYMSEDPRPMVFDHPFNTVILKDLTLQLLAGKKDLLFVRSFLRKNLPPKNQLAPTQPEDLCPTKAFASDKSSDLRPPASHTHQ